MFSSSALFFDFSKCFAATQVAKDGYFKLNKFGHFVLDKYHKMLSKICRCS